MYKLLWYTCNRVFNKQNCRDYFSESYVFWYIMTIFKKKSSQIKFNGDVNFQ